MDSGPFIHALEMVTGKRAAVLGKPNRAFFEQALLALGVAAHETVMVGDDLENDIRGAQQLGMRAVLVSTGKHGADSPALEHIQPDEILLSVGDLPGWLQEQAQV
jgi:ribonucleotide monophosphatase NagD (HAD superfamily)